MSYANNKDSGLFSQSLIPFSQLFKEFIEMFKPKEFLNTLDSVFKFFTVTDIFENLIKTMRTQSKKKKHKMLHIFQVVLISNSS